MIEKPEYTMHTTPMGTQFARHGQAYPTLPPLLQRTNESLVVGNTSPEEESIARHWARQRKMEKQSEGPLQQMHIKSLKTWDKIAYKYPPRGY